MLKFGVCLNWMTCAWTYEEEEEEEEKGENGSEKKLC